MERVIHSSRLDKYDINKYRYISFENDGSDNFEPHPVFAQQNQKELSGQHTNEDVAARYEQNQAVENEQASAMQAQIETFLQKIDELSSSLVKMEMQMERQQNDFDTRLEEERRRSYDDGYNGAKSELEALYDAKISEGERLFTSTVQKLEQTVTDYSSTMSDVEKDLPKTAVSIAEQVIAKEIAENSSRVAFALTKELLSALKGASKIKIKANRQDVSYLRAAIKDNQKITIEEDEAIQKGGVIVLSDIGNLDGNINSRLAKVKEDLLDELR